MCFLPRDNYIFYSFDAMCRLVNPAVDRTATRLRFYSFALELKKRSRHSPASSFPARCPARRVPAQGPTGIFPIFACQIFGAVSCTDSPFTSTATDTGMSCTSNS